MIFYDWFGFLGIEECFDGDIKEVVKVKIVYEGLKLLLGTPKLEAKNL